MPRSHSSDHHDPRPNHPRQPSHRPRRRSRSRSPYNSHRADAAYKHHNPRRSKRETRSESPPNRPLPFNARALSKHDYSPLRSLFGLYLEVQKQLDLEELGEREARGRWKSFVGKWNRGELAEGWYDPQTFTRAESALREEQADLRGRAFELVTEVSTTATTMQGEGRNDDEHSDDDDDDYGPALPSSRPTPFQKPSATVPSIQDLALRRETESEEHSASLSAHRLERKGQRRLEKERLDELVPKAEAGTRERQLEKKRDAAQANRAFAASKNDAGGTAEIRDEELMGGGDDLEELRRMKRAEERKKSDRELRREEVLRAKQAERNERMQAYKEKEERTMAGLVALAKQRFG